MRSTKWLIWSFLRSSYKFGDFDKLDLSGRCFSRTRSTSFLNSGPRLLRIAAVSNVFNTGARRDLVLANAHTHTHTKAVALRLVKITLQPIERKLLEFFNADLGRWWLQVKVEAVRVFGLQETGIAGFIVYVYLLVSTGCGSKSVVLWFLVFEH